MTSRTSLLVLLPLLACAPAGPASPQAAPPPSSSTSNAAAPAGAVPEGRYPIPTRVSPVADVLHGVRVEDPYRWLEDGKSEEVRAWVSAQDRFAREHLSRLPLREQLLARLTELNYVDEIDPPVRRGKRYFWRHRRARQEKAVVYWREGKAGAERVLLDPNTWSADGSVSLGAWSVSWDGKKIAYQVKKNAADEATLEVVDVQTGQRSAVDVIDGAKYSWFIAWTPRSDGFYYTWVPPESAVPATERPGHAEIRLHELGEDPKRDATVRERTGDTNTFVWAKTSKDGRWLFTTVARGWTAWEISFLDLREPGARFRPLAVGRPYKHRVEAYKDRFYVITDDGAPNRRVFRVDPAHPERDRWVEIVPERKDAILESMSIVGGRIGLSYLKDVKSQLELRELDGKLVREIPLPGIGASDGLEGDPDEDEAYFSFSSLTHPPQIHEVSIKTGATRVLHGVKVPIDPSAFVLDQVFATSKDGTRVPVFVVHQRGLKRDGSAPLMLWGYGGFTVAEKPTFRPGIHAWLEQGGVYALANIRGGSEYGEQWYRQGMLRNRQNSYDDFIAASEHLIAAGYTRPDRLVITGHSNGGLLVGAALTQRPDLYRVALCAVPLADMVRYHHFGVAKTWIQEYGSPDDPDDFRALFAYSPYHNVKPGVRYPSVLLLSADSDDRVDPMHARKLAARLQASSAGGKVLLRVEKNAGHSGADTVQSLIEEQADAFAFALSEVQR